MISLEEAYKIAKEKLDEASAIVDVYNDLGDCWIFQWADKTAPNMIYSGSHLIRVDKEKGQATWFTLGVPGEESFEILTNAEKRSLSKYIPAEELIKYKERTEEEFLAIMGFENLKESQY